MLDKESLACSNQSWINIQEDKGRKENGKREDEITKEAMVNCST